MASAGYCDGLEVWSKNEILHDPYDCDMGFLCQYRSMLYQNIIDKELCLCAGLEDGHKGYCGKYMTKVRSNIGNIFANMQYDESICSGESSHTNDIDILYACKSINEDDYNYYKSWELASTYWNLYQSGVIHDCAVGLGLFDPNFDGSFLIQFLSSILVIFFG